MSEEGIYSHPIELLLERHQGECQESYKPRILKEKHRRRIPPDITREVVRETILEETGVEIIFGNICRIHMVIYFPDDISSENLVTSLQALQGLVPKHP